MHGSAENIIRWRLILLFYVTLFIASFTVILVVLWLLRLIASLTRVIYQNHLPNEKQGPTAHLSEKKYGKNAKLASRAWGSKPHATPKSYPVRNKLERKRVRAWKKSAGKFMRDNRSGLSGQAYKPSQDARSTFAIDKK